MTQEQTKTEQWTAGPWHTEFFESSPDSPFVCSDVEPQAPVVIEFSELGNPWANAELVAAAPGLYAALKNLVARYDESEINAAIAALAKANGR